MAQIGGLQDFRKTGPPGDIGTHEFPATAIVFPIVFSGTTYYCALDAGAAGWVLISYGTNPTTVINAAITRVGTLGGGTVHLRGGTTYNANVTMNQADVILEGEGWSTIINGGNAHAIAVTAPRCAIRNLQCRTTFPFGGNDGVNAGTDAQDLRIENIYVNGVGQDGIFTNAERTMITGCYIYNTDRWGIILGGGADRSRIVDNLIIDTGNDGITISAGCNDCAVKGNKIAVWTNEAIDDDGTRNEIGDGHVYVFGVLGAVTGGATGYPLPGQGAWSATELLLRLPYRGYIRDLYVRALTAPGGAVTDTITVRLSAVPTAVTTTLVGAATENADATNRVQTGAAGDTISISYAAGAGSVAANIIIVIEVREVNMD